MLSMAIVPRLPKKMDKKTLFIRQSVIFAAADVIVFFVCTYVFPYTSPDLRLALIGLFVYAILRFFTNFPVGMSTVLLTAMFSDTVDTIEMDSGERLEGATFSFKGLINKFGVAGFNLIMMMAVNAFEYEKLQALAQRDLAGEAIERGEVLANKSSLTALFFMLTVLGAIGLVLQRCPILRVSKSILSLRIHLTVIPFTQSWGHSPSMRNTFIFTLPNTLGASTAGGSTSLIDCWLLSRLLPILSWSR